MNKCRYYFLVFLVTVTLYGCASTPRLEFPYYGNFCGPGHPRVDGIEALEKIKPIEKPIDDVDAACQQHDLCYARKGRQNEMCDELLERELDHRSLSPACASLALDIKNWFRSAHPNSGVARNIYKMTLGLPLFAAQYSTNLLGIGVRPPHDTYLGWLCTSGKNVGAKISLGGKRC
ncbi:MAG: hypothetical protein ACREVK_08890 [Gammaproteobacteria bacterium]